MAKKSTWKVRIVGHGEEAPDQLLANPSNFRRHPKNQQSAMAALLDRAGWVEEVTVNRTTGHLVDGHMRIELALRHGVDTVPVKYIEVDEDTERLILATRDPIGALAFTDVTALGDLLADVQSDHADIQRFIADLAEREGVLGLGGGDGGGGDDDGGDDGDDGNGGGYDPKDGTIVYQLVFDDTGQRDEWYRFLKWLRATVEGETHGERLARFIADTVAEQ